MVYAAISDVSKEGIYFGQNGELEGSHQGIFRPGSGDPAFLSKPSDLAPEVIGFGLIPAGDPNGPLIWAQDDLDQRPRPERCIEALPPPADAVRGDRGTQAPYRRWQRRDYGARSAEEDVGGRVGQLIRDGWRACSLRPTSAHISKIKQVVVPWTSSRPSRSVTLPSAVLTRRPRLITVPSAVIGPVWGVIGRRKDILNSRVVEPMPRSRMEWIARPILESSIVAASPP